MAPAVIKTPDNLPQGFSGENPEDEWLNVEGSIILSDKPDSFSLLDKPGLPTPSLEFSSEPTYSFEMDKNMGLNAYVVVMEGSPGSMFFYVSLDEVGDLKSSEELVELLATQWSNVYAATVQEEAKKAIQAYLKAAFG